MTILEMGSARSSWCHRNRRWLWTLSAVLVTSAVWAVALVAIRNNNDHTTDKPHSAVDLRGYHAVDDLCSITDSSPVTSKPGVTLIPGSSYRQNPLSGTSRHAAIDTMRCYMSFNSPSGGSTHQTITNIRVIARLYKQSDPTPEFLAAYTSKIDDLGSSFPAIRFTKVSGIGQDAYQAVSSRTGEVQNHEVQLWVRDGWMTYGITWFQEIWSDQPPSLLIPETDVLTMLQSITESTMKKLQEAK